MKIKQIFAATTLVFLVTSVGCHVNRELGPPGDMNTQRSRALLHDPFPSNELGPAIHGSRPRGFDQPRSESQKIQSNPNARRGGQPSFGGF
jgi:hypothetical protein